jgi:hypothetical protein
MDFPSDLSLSAFEKGEIGGFRELAHFQAFPTSQITFGDFENRRRI